MSYQPIQLGQVDYLGAAANIGRDIDIARERKRQGILDAQAQQRQQMLDERQKGMDYQNVLVAANKAAADGDVELAKSLLAPYTQGGFQPGTRQQPVPGSLGDAMGMAPAQTAPMGVMPPQGPAPLQKPPTAGGSAVPDQMDGGMKIPSPVDPAVDKARALKFMQMIGRAPIAADQVADFKAPPSEPPPFAAAALPPVQTTPPGPAMPPGQGGPGPMQPQQPNGIDTLQQAAIAERQKNAAVDQRRADQILKFKNYRGEDVTLDPQATAERQAARQQAVNDRQAAILNQNFDSQDPKQMLVGLVRSGLDPDKAFSHVAGVLKSREETAQRADDKKLAREQMDELRRLQIDSTAANSKGMQNAIIESARIGAGGRIAAAAPQVRADTANRGDLAAAEKRVLDYLKLADSKTVIRQNRALGQAMANIATEGPDAVLAHKSAFMKLAAFDKQGAAPTDSETKLFLTGLGGIPGALDAFRKEATTGDFSDSTLRNIAFASQHASAESQKQNDEMMKGINGIVGPGSGFEAQAPQVNNLVKGYGQLFGVNMSDVYPQAEGPGTMLGSGVRPQSPIPKKASAASGGDDIEARLKRNGH